MSTPIPYIAAEEVHDALDYRSLVNALRDAFVAGAVVPVRSSHAVTERGDRLLLMPAWGDGGLGVKIVTVYAGNRARGLASVAALYVLLDGDTGHPIALIDGEALTLRRTAAASALASSYLSREDARCLLVVGTGALAPHMAMAHASVRPIDRIIVWGRSHERAARMADALTQRGLNAQMHTHLPAALSLADVVCCATTSREPLILGHQVHPGQHVDLVGAFTPDMRESDDGLVTRATIFVDTFAGALKEAGDLVQAMAAGVIARDDVVAELADLARGAHCGRTSSDEITLFKSVGTALEDLCAARLVAGRHATTRHRSDAATSTLPQFEG